MALFEQHGNYRHVRMHLSKSLSAYVKRGVAGYVVAAIKACEIENKNNDDA